MAREKCRTITLPDGTQARVMGSLSPEGLQALKDSLPEICWAESTVRYRPSRGGNGFYHCGRVAGHEPPHQWPGNGPTPGSIAEWADS